VEPEVSLAGQSEAQVLVGCVRAAREHLPVAGQAILDDARGAVAIAVWHGGRLMKAVRR
jgi:hypothetical protein